MDTSRFLILGAKGQLGIALSKRFPNAQKASRAELDVSDWKSLQKFDWQNVDVILNAAANTNIDGSQTIEGREVAWKINAQAVGYLTKIAIQHDVTLVHISSDYVFDGTKPVYNEDELFTPLGVYGQTKAAGDIAAGIAPKHYIVRASWVVGEGKNFVRTMIGLAGKNISPTVVSDQIGRLTFTDQLVDGIEHLLKQNTPYGTYNISNDGESASWAEITRVIFKELGRDDLTVTDTTTAEYFKSKPESAPRPLQSTLDLGKMKTTGFVFRNWRDDLHAYIEQERTNQL